MRLPTAGLTAAFVATLLGMIATNAAEHDDRVADVISARLALMRQVELGVARAEQLVATGASMPDLSIVGAELAAELAAFGLLFPETTNLLGGLPAPEGVVTTAAPAIWDDFDAFYALSSTARDHAAAMASATDVDAYSRSLVELRSSCASCHEVYVFYDPFAALN